MGQHIGIVDLKTCIVISRVSDVAGIGNILHVNIVGVDNIKSQRVGGLGRSGKGNGQVDGSVHIAIQDVTSDMLAKGAPED